MADLSAGTTVLAADTPPTKIDRQDASIGTITSTTYEAGATACGTSFTAPTTGRVMIYLNAQVDHSDATRETLVSVRVGTGATVGAGTEVFGATDNVSVSHLGGNQLRAGVSHLLEGLTAGNTYNVQTMHRVTTGGNGTVARRSVIVCPAT